MRWLCECLRGGDVGVTGGASSRSGHLAHTLPGSWLWLGAAFSLQPCLLNVGKAPCCYNKLLQTQGPSPSQLQTNTPPISAFLLTQDPPPDTLPAIITLTSRSLMPLPEALSPPKSLGPGVSYLCITYLPLKNLRILYIPSVLAHVLHFVGTP